MLLVLLRTGERELASTGGLSVGITSAAQGRYSRIQFLLDVTQGARIAASAYPLPAAPILSLRTLASGGIIEGWAAARSRAETAPATLIPGLLAGSIRGGGAYAGINGIDPIDGVLAADRLGRIAAVSVGPPSTLLARVARLARSSRLVVADLPSGASGRADLRALSASRPAQQLLIVVQRVLNGRGGELLWTAAGGLAGGGGKELSSQSTSERGLISAVDLAPTILAHLREGANTSQMAGRGIETDGGLDSAGLRSLMARLRVIGTRRLRALGFLLAAWAIVLLLASPWPGARARAMRAGAIGILWAPVAALLTAALEPSAAVEYLTIALGCLLLGSLTDALIAWPRAVLAPALGAVVLLSADALAGSQLLMRSLLGPDPILGARFYGIGNELKSGLAVLVLAGVASALYPARRGRRASLSMLAAGIVLGVIEGSARIGAGVGAVILVCAAFGVATIMMLEGALTRRRALIALGSPFIALAALAGIDLVSAHGGGHFTGSVLHARSAGEIRELIVRRYTAAWDELKNHMMPFATALALVCAALGVRGRERLLAPVRGDPAWLAALSGGLAGGVVGALVEDSGPLLFVVAVFTVGCVASYLWGGPPPAPHSRRRCRGSLSRARRPRGEPAR